MNNVNKAIGAGIVFFSVVLAGFVGARVDQTTIALLGGTFIGLLVAVPATLLVVLMSQRRRDEQQQHSQQPRYSAHMPPNPPQYWMMPQQPYDIRMLNPQPSHQAQLNSGIPAPEFMLPLSRRRFYMIGEGGEVKEIEAPHDVGFDGLDTATGF